MKGEPPMVYTQLLYPRACIHYLRRSGMTTTPLWQQADRDLDCACANEETYCPHEERAIVLAAIARGRPDPWDVRAAVARGLIGPGEAA